MVSVILMMAGNGSRMKLTENKVYLPLKEKRVYEYSLELFLKYNCEVVCVIRPEDQDYLGAYQGRVRIVYGGKTRQESVFNGLNAALGEWVLIHDAARPFLKEEILKECLAALSNHYACLVVAPCKDSVYKLNPLQVLNRNQLVLAQTPQGGNREELIKCHQQAKLEGFEATDDISLILKYGTSLVKLIEGNDTNFKITTQLDYVLAKELCKND